MVCVTFLAVRSDGNGSLMQLVEGRFEDVARTVAGGGGEEERRIHEEEGGMKTLNGNHVQRLLSCIPFHSI